MTATSNTFGFNWLFFKRTFLLCRIIFPSWMSLPSILFYTLILVALLEQILIYNVGMISSKYYTVLGSRDIKGFWSTTGNSLLAIASQVLVMSTKTYICNVLYVSWRQLLCTAIHQHYFFNIRYYQVNVIETIVDNPDQRVTQDVDKMCNVWSKIIDIIMVAPFRIAYYTYAAFVATGYIGPLVVVLFFVVSTVLNKLLMSPVVRLVVKQEKLEGDYRYKHMHVRSNAESLAFFNGGPTELDETNNKLNTLIATQMKLFNRQYPLTISINLTDYVGSILSYLIIAVPIFGGKYNSYDAVQLSSLISQTSFVCMYLVNSFTQLVDQADKVTNIAGCTHRVGQLLEELVKLRRATATTSDSEKYNRSSFDGNSSEGQKALCTVENVSFGPPNSSDNLVQDLNMSITKKVNVLITGDSGSGKSSLLRVLCGVWSLREGWIRRNYKMIPKEVLFLPQKPYFSGGSLYRQVVFPLEEDSEGVNAVETELIVGYLRLANLEMLLERTGGLFETPDWNWCDVLSPGELQRLSFVRLFYHRPRIAYLDEASSALNLEMEEVMYKQCEILGITLVSVGHRHSLRKFHSLHLHLSGSRGNWRLDNSCGGHDMASGDVDSLI